MLLDERLVQHVRRASFFFDDVMPSEKLFENEKKTIKYHRICFKTLKIKEKLHHIQQSHKFKILHFFSTLKK